jgi:universal stress protein E
MPAYRKVLIALKDLNAKSMPALNKAAQLAKAHGATLEIFHALSQTVLVDALDAQRVSLKDFEAQQLHDAISRLQVLAKRMRKHAITVTCAAEWDYPPAEAIIRRALKTKADLIVAERHATKHVAGWMLSYTDWELLRQAPCPVLLIKKTKPYHRPKVLTAIDPFHQHEKPARLDAALLQASASLSGPLKGTLQIIHCVPPPTVLTAGWVAGPVIIDQQHSEVLLKKARKALAAEVARHPLPSHKIAVVQGAAREAIPLTAKSGKADIVVMGALSRSGLKRVLIGNTAEAVLDALDCDVLIVKPGKFQTKVARRSRGAQLMSLPNAITG